MEYQQRYQRTFFRSKFSSPSDQGKTPAAPVVQQQQQQRYQKTFSRTKFSLPVGGHGLSKLSSYTDRQAVSKLSLPAAGQGLSKLSSPTVDRALVLRPLTSRVPKVHGPPKLLSFTKNDYKNAELKCLTDIKCTTIKVGFTAESCFYQSCTLQAQSTTFSHHQQSLQIFTPWHDRQKLKVELRYGFISKMNFEIRRSGHNYNITLTVVFTQTPLFYKTEQKPNETFTRFSRVNPQNRDINGFWKAFVDSSAFQMVFVLDKSELFSFLDSLSTTSSCSISFLPLTDKRFDSYRMDCYYEDQMRQWPWEVRYCIEAIKSSGMVAWFFMDHVLFVKNEYMNIVANGVLNEAWAIVLFTAIYDYVKSDISLSSLDFHPDKYEKRQIRGDGFVMIKTAYFTPTRVLLTLEEATMDCRGFRKLGVNNLIQIKFRDDSLSWFPIEDKLLHDVVKTVCQNGVDIAGRKFYEFGGSSSLFREHGSYFYATNDKKDIIEKWKMFGDFKFEAAAKVQARLGQYFTSARAIRFKIRLSNVCIIEDFVSDCVDSAGQPYCFSDGCGVIDPIFARKIADELELSYVPSAFQFRFAGFKGIVAVDYSDERLTYKDGQYFLLLRNSQKKFDVQDDGELHDFDIVQWSSPTPSKLHGAFIAMIDALAVYNKKEDTVRARLRQLHNETFIDTIKPLIDTKAFLVTLEKLPKYVPVQKLKAKNLLQQPFLRGMIEANALLNARLLVNKNQIAIPPDLGRGALGIVDTTGSLKEGQVFFQFSKGLKSKSAASELAPKIGGFHPVLKLGRVGVTKSPIYHVGDIRYLEAVAAPKLMDKVDVIVFPSCGTRPHTDEIGGGDLDGDWYTIFWDPDLLLESAAEPNDYTAPSVEEVEKVGFVGLQEDAPDIRVQYLKSNNLEQLSTTHLAHLTLHDPLHDDCEKLARKADKAVNFFKSGLEAEELEEHERPGYWPKFMGKRHEPGYTNGHILCELHEKSTSILHLITIAQREAYENRQKSGLIDIQDVQITEHDRKMFSEYKEAITSLKVRYQIKSEGELFSNSIVDVPGTLKNYKDPMGDEGCPSALVQRKVFEIFEKFRTMILNRFGPHTWRTEMEMKNENIFTYKIPTIPTEMIQLAKTYYAIAEEDGECFSFPWIAWEGLDAWWSQEGSNDDLNMKEHWIYEKEIHDLIAKDVDYAACFTKLRVQYPQYSWFSFFAVMFNSFMTSNNLLPELVSAAVNFYMSSLEKTDGPVKIPKCASEAFFNFLITIISPNFDHDGPKDEKEFMKLYKAAQSTLISYSFFPQNKHFFGIKLHEQVMTYPSFVISVPACWSKEFERRYQRLKAISGCKEVVAEKRKTLTYYIHYTIMCRGKLQACQKLESMLTPIIRQHESKTIKETKGFKGKVMQNLLVNIFGFKYVQKKGNGNGYNRKSNNGRVIMSRKVRITTYNNKKENESSYYK